MTGPADDRRDLLYTAILNIFDRTSDPRGRRPSLDSDVRAAALALTDAIGARIVELVDERVRYEHMSTIEVMVAQGVRDHQEQAPHIYPDGSTA